MEKRYLPVFKGGLFRNNEIILPYDNFRFNSIEELEKANEETPFINFFPFPVIFSRVLEIEKGALLEGVEATFTGGEKVLVISGDWFDGVD